MDKQTVVHLHKIDYLAKEKRQIIDTYNNIDGSYMRY